MSEALPARCAWQSLTRRDDPRGTLVAIEEGGNCPFPIARVYFLTGTAPETSRGFHAHRALTQLVTVASGACTMLLDDGQRSVSVRLDDPGSGLVVGPMVWHEMSDFTENCVLLVLADAAYDERDYIRDLDEFRRLSAA